ncbi:amidohydrolase family protein [Rhizobium binxianense]
MNDQRIFDGYAHIGLPRFQTAEAAIAAMDANGIAKALVCPFETCPDIREVHRAHWLAPDRLRVFGLALGADRAEIERGLHAQFDAGFEGMRLTLERIAEVPSVLDVIAERKGIPLIVSSQGGAAPRAADLVAFLDAYPDSVILSPHMAGPTSPGIFRENAAVKALFTHPHFHVVMSRQTLFEPPVMLAWGEALIEHVGFDRLMWGSEAPVLYWRDETLEDALSWIEQFKPSETELAAFRFGNAERVLFGRPVRESKPLALPYDPFDFELRRPAPMWPIGFNADTRLPAQLVAAWMAEGGPKAQPLSSFASRLLIEATSRFGR